MELNTRLEPRGRALEVVATVRNVSSATQRFELPDRCPAGPVVFQGLPPGYDYYQTCRQGACPGERPPLRFAIGPGQVVELARIRIDPRGGTCNKSLPPGRHHVRFSLPGLAHTCVSQVATIEVPAPPPPPRPKKKHVRCPPMPTCGLACPGGAFAKDNNGCTLCACEKRTFFVR